MNPSTKQKQIHRHSEETYGGQGGEGEGEGWTGSWGWWMQTITFRMDKHRGPNVYHRELYSISCY